tara:strand:- start:1449 stop:1784 length:336 start_codon:yes stop_codon:yes gene_type:complete
MEDLSILLKVGSVDWLIIEPTLEQELALEKETRELFNQTDVEVIRQLSAALIRQNWYQSQVIKKSIQKIGQLEAQLDELQELALEKGLDEIEQKKTKSVWDLVFSFKQKSR